MDLVQLSFFFLHYTKAKVQQNQRPALWPLGEPCISTGVSFRKGDSSQGSLQAAD